jgi:TatD DNase family protein
MKTRDVVKEVTFNQESKDIEEMADAHCHLDMIADSAVIKDAVVHGVKTMITNGVDTKSNARSLELADNKHIFALLGIDPEHSNLSDEELEFNISMVRQNAKKIAGIGEIGLDYGKVKESVPVEIQKRIFERFLDLSLELNLPVSIHSRDALNDVLQTLEDKKIEAAHIHFFEGSVQQAKEVEKRGYMISVPPLQSGKRSKVIKEIAIDNIMAESDAPAAGSSPRDVERSIGIIREAKNIDFKKAAALLTDNTKRFFRIHTKEIFMRRF